MQIDNFRSHHPDAYRGLQETQTEPEGAQPERSACPAPPPGPKPDATQQNHRHRVEQAETRGRHLAWQAEARGRQPLPEHAGETLTRQRASKIPYPQDEALFTRYCEGASAGASNANTVSFHLGRLISISDYLRRRQLPAMSARLFSSELDNEVKQYQRDHNRSDCLAILRHLRSIESSKQGVTTIPNKVPASSPDHWLIEQVFAKENNVKIIPQYQSVLRSLSAWLAEKGKPGLCDPDYLNSDKLTADAREFSQTHLRPKCSAALQHLRNYDRAGKVNLRKLRDFSNIPPDDQRLITRYQKVANDALIFKASKGGKQVYRDANGKTSVDKYASTLRSFSGWLQEHNKGSLASLLHDPLLDTYKDLWAHNKSTSYSITVTTLLKRVRDMPVPDSSQPAAAGRHSSLALPDSAGPGWDRDPDTRHDITAPLRQPRPAASDSVFGDLSSLNSLSYQEFSVAAALQEVSGPLRRTQAAASDSVFGDLSSLNSLSYQEVTGPAAQHDFMEVDSHPSPSRTTDVAQRLASDPWLRDNDLVGYTQHIAAQLQSRQRADLLHFVDPQQVRLLTEGNQRLRNQVLSLLTGPTTPPILFMPVNHNNQHWSLLCVNRLTGQAFHYDSMVSPETAHLATDTAQFGLASRVAGVLGIVGGPAAVPIARQPDTQSCGDHVLSGMEVLAHRTVSGEIFQPGGLDLSAIRPNREHIVAVLTRSGAV